MIFLTELTVKSKKIVYQHSRDELKLCVYICV